MKPTGATSEWRRVYERYRELERSWSLGLPPDAGPSARTWEVNIFRELVRGDTPPDQIAGELRKRSLAVPPTWDEAAKLRAPLQRVRQAKGLWEESFDKPLDDAYQTALAMVLSGCDWVPHSNYEQVYRGYRNAKWPVITGLYRGGPTRLQLKQRLDRLRDMVHALRLARPDLSKEEQAVAVLQHYEDEADVKTWLLDVTWDPFIALHFASQGNIAPNDVGTVIALGFAEWTRFAAGDGNPMGEIKLVEVPGVPRIEAQRALFVDTSRPELFEQYVPYRLSFHQKPGLVFEDAGHETPVTRGVLTPIRK